MPPHVAAVLLALVRGHGTNPWVEDNVGPDDNCLEVLLRAGLVAKHEHFIDIVPAVGYSLGLDGWESPDEEPKRDPVVSFVRRL